MSYPRGLDEIPESELRAELARRLLMRSKNRCDYCERPTYTGQCRFPERHKAMRGMHNYMQINRAREFDRKGKET